MPAERVKLAGAAELKKALADLGTQVATRIGVAADRKAARLFEAALRTAAPVGAGDGRYGHLRDNIRTTKVRGTRATEIKFLVHTGRAFWGLFLEYGTVRAGATPWFRPTWDREKGAILAAQAEEMRLGIARASKRLGRPSPALPPPFPA